MKIYSKRDMDGVLWCDCTECQRGWYGDKSCGEGWAEDTPGHMGCSRGELLPEIREAAQNARKAPLSAREAGA